MPRQPAVNALRIRDRGIVAMTEFGIHTADHHLDVLGTPPAQPAMPGQSADGRQSEFQWAPFQAWATANNWNNGGLPAFAGRYFLGGAPNSRIDSNLSAFQQPPFQWGHGEGSLAQAAAPALQRIAPLQAADPDRQAETGVTGLLNGYLDATAFCRRLANCVVAGELSVSNAVVNVFLDVPALSGLSPDYWAGWASTVANFTVQGQPAPTQPFLPCICCAFDEDPSTQQYTLDPEVTTCLNTAQLKNRRLNARCYGFWAKAASSANLSQPLDWTRFPTYWQPLSATGSEPVWVLLWRYAEQSDPPAAGFAGGNRLTLEAAHEADPKTVTFDRMLQIGNFALAAANTSCLGVDRFGAFSNNDANCLGAQTILPPGIRRSQDRFTGPLSFAMRYYAPSGNPKLVTQPEITRLQGVGLRVGVVWQILGSVAEISAAGAGQKHALAAFNYAVTMQQPPHTPVYFGIDFDPGDPNTVDPAVARQIIETYFKDVLAGYQAYQQQQQPNPAPYEVGVYGAGATLRYCYVQGIASYFWETGSNLWAESNPIWPHANVVQTVPMPYAPCNFTLPGPNNIPPDTRVDFNASWGDEGAW